MWGMSARAVLGGLDGRDHAVSEMSGGGKTWSNMTQDSRWQKAENLDLRKILGQHMDFPTLLPVKVEAGDNW